MYLLNTTVIIICILGYRFEMDSAIAAILKFSHERLASTLLVPQCMKTDRTDLGSAVPFRLFKTFSVWFPPITCSYIVKNMFSQHLESVSDQL